MEGYIALQRIADGETVTATEGKYKGARISKFRDEVHIIFAGDSTSHLSEELTAFINNEFEIVKVVDFEEAVLNLLSGMKAERYDNGRVLAFVDNQFMTYNDEHFLVPTTVTPYDYEQKWRLFKD